MYFVAGAPILLLMGMAGLVVLAGHWPIGILNTLPAVLMGFSPLMSIRARNWDTPQTRSRGGFFGVGVGEAGEMVPA